MKQRLTNNLLGSTKPEPKDIWIHDAALSGLSLKVTPAGRKAFYVYKKVRTQKAPVRIKLGEYPALSVDQARAIASKKLAEISQGFDPRKTEVDRNEATRVQEGQRKAMGVSFGSVFESFQAAREHKPNTARDYRSAFRLYLSDWLEHPIRSITRQAVEERFVYVRDHHGLASAVKLVRYLSSVMTFAMADEVNGERLLTENPCLVIKQKKYRTAVKPRTNHLDNDHISSLMSYALVQRHWPTREKFLVSNKDGVSEQGLNYVLLVAQTGLRREEATAIRWSNVKGDHIEIPDTKNDIPHFVPITGSLKGILRSQRYQCEILKLSDAWRPQMDDWVFPAFSVSGHMTEPKSQVAKIAKATNTSFSVHDLRRTFSTHAMIAGVDYHKLKKAMNHKSQDITQQYVQASLQLVRPVFEAVERQFLLYHDSEAMLEAEHPELFEV